MNKWINRHLVTMLKIWVVAFTIFVIYLFSSLQSSRVESCKRSYGATIQIFDPFFPPVDKMSGEQLKNWNKLNDTVDDLQASCDSQVKVKAP